MGAAAWALWRGDVNDRLPGCVSLAPEDGRPAAPRRHCHGHAQPPQPALSAPLRIAVASGKGGVGKTNVSANLAIAFSQLGRRVLVVGADLGLANVELVLGLTPPATLLDVLEGRCTAQQAICNGPRHKVLPLAPRTPEMARLNAAEQDLDGLSAEAAERAAGERSSLVPPRGWDNVLSWFQAVDRVLVVTTPKSGALAMPTRCSKMIRPGARAAAGEPGGEPGDR